MVKEKVLDLANHISGKKRGKKGEILATDPEYLVMEPVVSDEMAEVCLHMEKRVQTNAKEVSAKCGKSEEETHALLMQLADAGVCFINVIDGVDTFWFEVWVPGIMEMMVAHKENVAKYPQIAEAFEAYGRVRGPATAGNFPVGVGLMRVIPIEKAIMGETRRASYEEVSKYLNDNDIFTVADCSCRTSREVMGEGCGHLKEDMCIQMGHAAEYYIRTGRGREITREEAFEIIARAEENGLMHQIPNLDGNGKTHAICNCCGCSCLSLRTAEMFINVDMVRSNYVSMIDKEKCVACGDCVANCPVGALKLGQKICSTTPVIEEIIRNETPRDMEWPEEKWNPDYRTNRNSVVETGTSPCKTTCPAHIAVQGYIKLASQGKYNEALELIKQENPFPAVCGRICPRDCESECTRGDVDEPVAIDDIKKFIAEQDLNAEHRFVPRIRHDYTDKKVAVIGAGPSGLSCAYYLAVEGYSVTVFEKQSVPGGMLTLGIPAFRLEKSVLNSEIAILEEIGVKFEFDCEVGKNVTIDELRHNGFKAFFIGIGLQGGRSLGIKGEDNEGVITGIDFLRDINLGKEVFLGGNVVVIGGGNVAIDVARAATRVGATDTSMYCLESAEEMPALDEEVEEAKEEGIRINNSWGPKEILIKNWRVSGVVFQKCVSVFDENGRFSPKYDENDTITVDADYVLLSIGQKIEWNKLIDDSKVVIKLNGGAEADPFTLQTAEEDIFVGGDAYSGAKFAIDAIAQGKIAAVSIHRFVNNGQSLVIGRDRREYVSLDKDNLIIEGFDNSPRQRPIISAESMNDKSFKDMRGTLSEEQMQKEAERCLGCGATIRDEFLCVGCGQCVTKCKFEAITLERKYDGEGVAWEDIKPVVVKHLLKRKVRILTRKLKRSNKDN